jgi:Panthothenate synthetase
LKIFKSIQEFNEARDGLGKLSFVPTMGNLQKGNTFFIDIEKQFENKIIFSIYVKKFQFNDDNDYLR